MRIFRLGKSFVNQLRKFAMSVDGRLDAIPSAEIDEGVFKYILIKVYGKEDGQGNEMSKLIVRYSENHKLTLVYNLK